MIGAIIVLFIFFCIGVAVGISLSVPVINRLESKVKKLDMATGYRFRSEIQN